MTANDVRNLFLNLNVEDKHESKLGSVKHFQPLSGNEKRKIVGANSMKNTPLKKDQSASPQNSQFNLSQ